MAAHNTTVFSSRLPPSLAENAVSRAVAAARARGPLLDLTESNPTAVGLDYPRDAILAALADPRALAYEPTPRGLPAARAAVADYYARKHARAVDAERIFLSASTSEAYAWLFKLLCDPGDEVLVPRPSYPLFELLAGLECARPVQYRLHHHHGWFLDGDELERAVGPHTRAIVVVNPNNPAGWIATAEERARIDAIAARHRLAVISDEVFADYAFEKDAARATTFIGDTEALTFSLSGLSKVVGLPQLKLGWIVSSGPRDLVTAAGERLEHIADTFLSVASPVQHALPSLLPLADGVAAQICNRAVVNRAALKNALAGSAAQLLDGDGGWSALVRVPATRSDEAWMLALLQRGVLVHPGFFFDIDRPTTLVVSLLVAPEILAAALPIVADTVATVDDPR
jgi:alanine-synthesizing transaminase